MVNQSVLSPRVRLTGLLASVIAVVALGVTVLADNSNVGFGHTITRGEQVSLLLAAQTIAYLIHGARRSTKHETDGTTTAARGARN